MTIHDMHQAIKLELDKSTIASYDDFLIEEIDYFVNKSYLETISTIFGTTESLQLGYVVNIQKLVGLQGLVNTVKFDCKKSNGVITNKYTSVLPEDTKVLYPLSEGVVSFPTLSGINDVRPVIMIDYQSASKFKSTYLNSPWIPTPVMTMTGDSFEIYVDTVDMKEYVMDIAELEIPCITKPTRLSYYMIVGGVKMVNTRDDDTRTPVVSSSVQNAIVQRAVDFMLENIESQRIQTHPVINANMNTKNTRDEQ